MAVANTVMDVLQEDGFLAGVREMGERLFASMIKFSGDHPGAFEDVRGAGMMIGLKCIPPAGDFVAACREEGLLTVPAGDNVMRLLPPLVIDETHIAECVEMMGRAWERLSS